MMYRLLLTVLAVAARLAGVAAQRALAVHRRLGPREALHGNGSALWCYALPMRNATASATLMPSTAADRIPPA